MEVLFEALAADFRANRGRLHLFVVISLFRVAHAARNSDSWIIRSVIGLSLTLLYRSVSLLLFSIDIPTRTVIGSGLAIHHGFGIVVHADATIGRDVTLRQGVTIGAMSGSRRAPIVGDGVEIGASALVVGAVRIGDCSVVGAGSVVVRDVPEAGVVAGNPARLMNSA